MQSFFRAIQVVLLQSCAGKMHTEDEHVVLIHVKDLFALEEYDQSNVVSYAFSGSLVVETKKFKAS
ncbi:hypothetical protein Hdeb2414_s0007g00240871 [Helianthus debilis subsp. tardiflorus]